MTGDHVQDLEAARERLREQAASAPAYLTVPEAAELARCNPKTIRRAYEDGSLRAFRPVKRVLLREDDVRAWVERRSAIDAPRPRPRRSERGRPAPGSVSSLRAMDQGVAR